MHVIDLSIPVRNGDGRLGLEVRFETPYRFEDCGYQRDPPSRTMPSAP